MGQLGEHLEQHDLPLRRLHTVAPEQTSGHARVAGRAHPQRALALADDAPAQENWPTADSLIDAVYLPVDGPYRIEAQSFLDDTAGGYTLTIESRRLALDPAVLQSYAGRYEAPWGVIFTVSLEDGRLYLLTGPEKHALDPISETDFMGHPYGWRMVFMEGKDGRVSGFDLIDRFGRGEYVRLDE